jgi:hypothetical protein
MFFELNFFKPLAQEFLFQGATGEEGLKGKEMRAKDKFEFPNS